MIDISAHMHAKSFLYFSLFNLSFLYEWIEYDFYYKFC